MPTLPRLSRHSNRSQNALVEPPVAAAGGGTGDAASIQAQGHQTRPSQSQSQVLNQAHNKLSKLCTKGEPQEPAELPSQNTHAGPSAQSSNVGFSSSESSFIDPRPPPPPLSTQDLPSAPLGPSGGAPLPAQVYRVSPDTSAIDSPVFDSQHREFIEPTVNRSQSQRYSTYAALPHQQQVQQQGLEYRQQAYGAGSASLENLPVTAGYAQPPHPAPEKKSKKRGFIKGFFSGSSRSSSANQQHHQQSPAPPQAPPQSAYDNTGGLARRASKRESTVPVINTRLSQQNQYPPERDWQVPGSYSVENSPLPDVGEVDEYQYHSRVPESDQDVRLQESRTSTIRPVGNEPETPYDEGAYQTTGAVPAVPTGPTGPYQHQRQQHQGPPPPPHQSHQHQQLQQSAPPSQPHVQLHQQDQPHRHDQAPLYTQQPPSGHTQQQQQQQQQLQYAAATPPTSYQQVGEPRLATSQLAALQQQHRQSSQSLSHHHHNSETVSQVSHESPVTDPDQRSSGQQSAQASPAASYPTQVPDLAPTPPSNPSSTQLAGPHSQAQQSSMAPPSGAPPTSRDNKAPPRGDVPSGPPPSYRHSNASMGTLNIPPGQPGSQNPVFRDGTPRFESPGMDQGRHSPQPDRETAEGEKAFKDLLTKYKNVKRLYFDGKSQIENLTGQVEQLQNAVANQRIAQSRTALDDNEYATRFNRLNGAINNLSFNIRKDWRSLPPWLAGFVSPDALKTGKQEMTAVGRAVVSRWIVGELFDKCFHPGLDNSLSSQLKEIELSIRGNAYTMTSQEEFTALTTKVVHWRMTTLDGLQQTLNSPAAAENRQTLTSKATSKLTTYLYQFLNNPPPPGVEGSTSMIVELAVGIAANLPLESRDVAIMYPLPGEIVRPEIMEVEKIELPALEVEAEGDSDYSEDEKDKGKSRGEKTKSALPKDNTRVRFAGFPAWEVRGRQVLMKAPVWTV